VTVVGHLRSIKDPLRAAKAVCDLPESSRIKLIQIGSVLEDSFEREVRKLEERNDRYHWKGELPRDETLRWIARSHVTINSSVLEGGAHVVSEAIACETPVVASEISGNVGLLGEDYPGYFPKKNTESLRSQLLRAEGDDTFYNELRRHILNRKWVTDPDEEKRRWDELIGSVYKNNLRTISEDTPI